MQDKLKTILQNADSTAGPPQQITPDLAAAVRHRAQKRRIRITTASIAAGLLIAAGLGISLLVVQSSKAEQQRIAMLEVEVQQLQARADATLRLVKRLVETERHQRRLADLREQLAAIPDPIETMQMEVEGAASILLYEADKMYTVPAQVQSAVAKYNRLIKLYPDTHCAKTAKARLAEIEIQSTNKKDMKI